MSRSRWKSHTKFGRFSNFVCYFSNKKSRTLANQKFRTINKKILRKYLSDPNITDDEFLYRLRECSNVWDFDSDGLKHYMRRDEYCGEIDDAEWNSYKRK